MKENWIHTHQMFGRKKMNKNYCGVQEGQRVELGTTQQREQMAH